MAEGVEWLAMLWQLTDTERESGCANPHLLTLLRIAPRLSTHSAVAQFARLRSTRSRDRLIKELVSAAHGAYSGGNGLLEDVQDFGSGLEELLGSGSYRHILEARAEAERRISELAGELDPSRALADVTGERLALRVVVGPSLFLPLPQAGRHGALVQRPEGWIAHLHFGFPLHQDPQQAGITRPWVLGGAWHYAIDVYLRPRWPSIAQRIARDRDLAESVRSTLRLPPDAEDSKWVKLLRMHLNVAFKCLLSRRFGVPSDLHRAFAMARGLVLFPWFEEWLLKDRPAGESLDAHLSKLPEAMASERRSWEALESARALAPPTINLALISESARRARLVVPDAWGDDAVGAVAGWRLLPLPVMRYGEWLRSRDEADPVIAFGDPEGNPLVRRVLEQRGLSLDDVEGSDPAVIALSEPGFQEAAWCIAVAVRRIESARSLRMETALQETSSYVILDDGAILHSARASLDELV